MPGADFKLDQVRGAIAALGRVLSVETLAEAQRIYAPYQEREPYHGLLVSRDLAYGADERHRLDIFRAEGVEERRPALIFVHGGGFVAGEKRRPGSPFYDNIAVWAARQGLVGINMTYRLAPQHPWPAGAEDMGAAVAWLRGHAEELGVDPARIVLMGQSAGAAHAASYIARSALHGAEGHGLAAAIVISGVYDLTVANPKAISTAYFGTDPSLYEERSSIAGLAASDLPLLVAVAEHDPSHFEHQALRLLAAVFERTRHLPRFLQLSGHNHLSGVLHLGLPGDCLGPEILRLARSS